MTELVLVRGSQEVEHDLNRVEGLERYLNEKCIPIAHRSVPESWKFKSLEFAALIALRTDESRILVHIPQQIETLSLIIMQAAYDIYRIEVGC